MNNYELSRLIVDDVMKKVNAGEQVFYMEYVHSVEALLNKHAAQHRVQPTVLTHCPNDGNLLLMGFCDQCKSQYPHSG